VRPLQDRFCPGCAAEAPATRIASLADLGDCDPDTEIWPAEEALADPAHDHGCTFGLNRH
jgi:hypothetical protein